MADTLIGRRTPRAIDEHVIDELEVLLALSGEAIGDGPASDLRNDVHDTLFAIERLPLTAANAKTRARAVAVLHGGNLDDWQDDSPMGLLVQQIVETALQ